VTDAKLSFSPALAALLGIHCTKRNWLHCKKNALTALHNALNLTVQSTSLHAAIENATSS